MLTKIETEIKISPFEIDAAGHVNNAEYLKWFEETRLKLMEHFLPLQKLMEQNLYPVVARSSVEYKRALRLFDKPICKVELSNIEKFAMDFKYEVICGGKISARGEQRIVFADLTNGSMIRSMEKVDIFKNVLIL